MLLTIIKGIAGFAGFGSGQSVQNAISGIALHSLAVTGGVYFVHHYNDNIPLVLPLWNVALFGSVLYLGLEYLRRKLPGAP